VLAQTLPASSNQDKHSAKYTVLGANMVAMVATLLAHDANISEEEKKLFTRQVVESFHANSSHVKIWSYNILVVEVRRLLLLRLCTHTN
jgi:hypothetical protein